MTTDFATIDTLALDTVTGGAGVDAKAQVNLDLNKPVGALDQLGTAASRVIGCSTGASSMREFGNCMLTGQLGNVPQAPARQ